MFFKTNFLQSFYKYSNNINTLNTFGYDIDAVNIGYDVHVEKPPH